MSLTENLELRVSARHLTDPAQALRLSQALTALFRFEHERGHPASAAFVEDLRAALIQYAHELSVVHDQVTRDVMNHWEPTLDHGPIDDDDPDDDEGPTFYRRGGPVDGIQ